jgi:hypothetical protein
MDITYSISTVDVNSAATDLATILTTELVHNAIQ